MGKRNKIDGATSGDAKTKKKKIIVRDIEEVNTNDGSTFIKHKKDKKNKDKTKLKTAEALNKGSDIELQSDTISKKSRKLKIKEIDRVSLIDASSPIKQGKSEKITNNVANLDAEAIVSEDSKLDDLVPQLEKTKKAKKFKSKQVGFNKGDTCSLPSKKSKKIVFVDDEPCEVPLSKETVNTNVKQKKFLNDDEAEVNDEDIDKFCDELDEKDNKQYEVWVELIEAKLHENKKLK